MAEREKDIESSEIFIFWLKVIFGIVAGISNYFILRYLFHLEFFLMKEYFNGFLIIFLIYIILIYLISVLIFSISKKYFPKIYPSDGNIWKYSWKFSKIFVAIFLITCGITFYIGF